MNVLSMLNKVAWSLIISSLLVEKVIAADKHPNLAPCRDLHLKVATCIQEELTSTPSCKNNMMKYGYLTKMKVCDVELSKDLGDLKKLTKEHPF